LAVVVASLARPGHAAPARAEDVCPEPNNTFQAACFLGAGSDALGFISRPDDTDAYRIEVLDFDVRLRVELDRPFPYRLEVADWNGEVIAGSMDGAIETRLGPPGIYYIFVDSPGGQSSDSRAYRIARRLNYPAAAIPTVLYTTEFRGGPGDVFTDTGTNTSSDELGDYTIGAGRIEIAMKVGGTPEEPVAAKFFLPPEPPDPGPIVTDFSMAADARVSDDVEGGYEILFRYQDSDNYYALAVSAYDQQVALYVLVDGEHFDLVEWTQAPAVRKTGVNRTIVRAIGSEIRVNVNGVEVLRAGDDTFSEGMVGYGAATWGAPATVNFDNIIVTTPTYR
jgi:hypothetical protein